MTGSIAMYEARGIRLALPDRGRKHGFRKAPMTEILKGVDIAVSAGECVGIVGESGSGKSTLARTLVRLYQPTAGTLTFEGADITVLDERELRPLRERMQLVFQDSQSALNPRLTLGSILAEPFLAYRRVERRRDALERAADLLTRVGLSPDYLGRYPHQLSGGQRQRIGIARAVALSPQLVIADEIVSGLDVSVQAQILDLLAELQKTFGMALILISHDLSVVRAVCERVLVMRHGVVVEQGRTSDVFHQPQQQYTKELLRAIPLPEVDRSWVRSVAV
jgi:ABC-type oligopeptide transport system ATPase subunit